jgi:DNA-binding beta-propeller fold protein YncE
MIVREIQWSLITGKEANPVEPMLIIVDRQGNMYAAVSENTDSQVGFTLKIVKVNSQGKFLLEWGSVGKGQGQFEQLEAITTDKDGNVFVSDTLYEGESFYLGRVQKFDSSGHFLLQWKGGESKDWDLKNPSALAVDSRSRVFVADAELNTVEVFDAEGQFITRLAGIGSTDGQLNVPVGIAIDSAGYIVVAEFGSQRVQKWKLRQAY